MVKKISSKDFAQKCFLIYVYFETVLEQYFCFQFQSKIKARRLVERYNELPDRYMQVVGRCRDPNTLDELEALRASRPVRKENKARVQAERSIERTQRFEAKQAKM